MERCVCYMADIHVHVIDIIAREIKITDQSQ